MITSTRATIEDLYQVRGKAELVEGEIVHVSPTGAAPNYAAGEILVSLRGYARRTKAGYAVGDNARSGSIFQIANRLVPTLLSMLERGRA